MNTTRAGTSTTCSLWLSDESGGFEMMEVCGGFEMMEVCGGFEMMEVCGGFEMTEVCGDSVTTGTEIIRGF